MPIAVWIREFEAALEGWGVYVFVALATTELEVLLEIQKVKFAVDVPAVVLLKQVQGGGIAAFGLVDVAAVVQPGTADAEIAAFEQAVVVVQLKMQKLYH